MRFSANRGSAAGCRMWKVPVHWEGNQKGRRCPQPASRSATSRAADLKTFTLCRQLSHTLIICPPAIELLNYPHLVAMLVALLAKKECFSIVSHRIAKGFIKGPYARLTTHSPCCVKSHMQLCVTASVLGHVCVHCWLNGPLQLYYLAMNHEPSLQPAHCALKVKQTN